MSRYILSIILSLILITGSVSAAVVYPSSTPSAETTGGTFNQYFTNMFTPTCTGGSAINGFSALGVPTCVTLGSAGNIGNYPAILSYAYNGTPTYGVKIKTNIPWGDSIGMPTVRIEGFDYGGGLSIGLLINWYVYAGNFYSTSNISSYGGYTPVVKLANENGKVVIFIDDRRYYDRFVVSAYDSTNIGTQASYFAGWTTADEALTGTNIYALTYKNNFGGNVGIGTMAPGARLHIAGTTDPAIRLDKTSGSNYNYMEWAIAGIRKYWTGIDSAGVFTIQGENGNIALNPLIGNVGVGTSTPSAKLDVVGTRSNTIDYANAISRIGGSDVFLSFGALNGTPNYATWMQAVRSSDNAPFDMLLNPNGGNVGIGTSSPSYKLQVNGVASFNDANPTYTGAPTYRNTYNNTIYLGSFPISYTLYDSYDGGYWGNLFIGGAGMWSGRRNTLNGQFNQSVGGTALGQMGTGTSNNVFGWGSFKSMTTGGQNTAMGRDTGYNLTTGNNNSFFGAFAGRDLITGDNNIAIGYNAQLPSTTASNQLSIGNWIYGNNGSIGFGTSSPNCKFTIAGTNNGFCLSPDGGVILAQTNAYGNSPLELRGSTVAIAPGGSHPASVYVTSTQVGIGTEAPGEKLDVSGRIRVGRGGIVGSYGNTTNQTSTQNIWSIGSSWNLDGYSSTSFGNVYGMAYSYDGYGGLAGWGHQISFHDNGTRNAAISLSNGNAFFGGNVGIGTSSPSKKLDVAGDINFTGDLYKNGVLWTTATPWSGITGKPTTLAGYGITDFISSNSTNPVSADSTTTNGNYYVNGNIALFGQSDGALYTQSYNPSWVGQIYQDYRTGQIALRGKNSGTWQAWRTALDSTNFINYGVDLTTSQNISGIKYFLSNKGAGSYVGGQNTYALEAYSNDGGAAGMSFHRAGYYAINMGLDPDNVFRIGGWSAGANRWQLDMAGNETVDGAVTAARFASNQGSQSPNNSHPGYGIRPFYSWNIGQANNPTSGYSNGITIGSHPGDQSYGFQIVQNMWDDQLYFRRYNAGWQSWRTACDNSNNCGYRAFNTWQNNHYSGTDGAEYATIFYDANNAGYYVNPDGTSNVNSIISNGYNYASDRRLKTDIVPLKNSLDHILRLDGYSFKWKSTGVADIGVIAQEVEQIFPTLVHTDSTTGIKSVEYGNLVAPIIEAIKELATTIKTHTTEIDELKSENRELKKRLDAIEARLSR